LAITQRVDTQVLVVDGWLRGDAMRNTVEEFRIAGGYVGDSTMTASTGASRFQPAGLPEVLIQIVHYRTREQDRTYSSAVALHDWLRAQQPSARG
jgi:hypothetical protein